MSGGRIFNGVDARTGRYLTAPASEEEFARRIRSSPLTSAQLLEYKWWVTNYAPDDPKRAPAQDVDPRDLSSAGWGVLFAPSVSPEVERALQPLLRHRQQVAGANFRNYRLPLNRLASKEAFFTETKTRSGPANPKGGKLPYYLLIVGNPAEISFAFQYDLDVQYAVGRLHFTDKDGQEDIDAYAAYARNVVETEQAAAARRTELPPKQITLFGVSQQGDRATERAEDALIRPLAQTLTEDRQGWRLTRLVGPQADKEQLSRLLGGSETPSLLLTTSHGMVFPYGDEHQRSRQGALLCQDWPGDPHPAQPEHYFSGEDLSDEADLRGLISFHFACYSGGTPDVSSFFESSLSQPKRLAPAPFVSGLAQRLLSHPRGALAVVGHVDKAWSTSFSWSDHSQIGLYENTLKRLIDGHPIGSAMEFFNQCHAELAVDFAELCKIREKLGEVADTLFTRIFRANDDVRNFVVLGDPAVKVVYREAA
ncbi:MAG TPA: hypothetical protein VF789_15385 [Thermoanaerobaculia bacterium]